MTNSTILAEINCTLDDLIYNLTLFAHAKGNKPIALEANDVGRQLQIDICGE